MAGLTITRERSRAAIDSIEEPAAAPMKLWKQLARRDSPLLKPLAQALHEAADGATSWVTLDEELSISAMDGRYAAEGYAALEDEDALHRWLDLTTDLEGPTSLGFPWTLEDVETGPVAVLEAADVSPTIEIVLTPEWFDDHRRDRRERLLAWVVDVLSSAIDIRLLGNAYTQRRLVSDHADVLPSSVTEAVNDHLLNGPDVGDGPTAERAQEAVDSLAWDHPAWRVLLAVDETNAERLPYRRLYNDPRFSDVSESGVRKRVQRLKDLGLVEPVDVNGDRHVALLPPARPALEAFRDEYLSDVPAPAPESRASGLTAADGTEAKTAGRDRDVSDPPNSPAGAVCSRPHVSGGEAGEAVEPENTEAAAEAASKDRLPAPSNGWLRLDQHHAAAAAGGDADIALCDEPVAKRDDPRSYSVSYDDDRDEVVVEIEADPDFVKTGARLAAALLDDRLMSTVLTTDRLAGGPDRDGLDGLEESNPIVLRRARHLGYLPKDGESANAFRSRLMEERRTLLKGLEEVAGSDGLTNMEAASRLLQRAHGLIGTVTHVYDLLGVDLVRRVTFPEFSRNWKSKRKGIAKFVSTAVSIGSKFLSESDHGSGYYVPHRILFEDREDKREYNLGTPQIRGDGSGEPIGSWVFAGPGIADLEGPLRERLEVGPGDLQEDGENFAPIGVDVDIVQGFRREAVAEVLARLGRIKRLEPTRRATSLLFGLLGNVSDVAAAIYALGAEDPGDGRDLELSELRFALSTLPADRLLPGVGKPGLSTIVAALIEADEPLSKAALADAAGVSKQTVRNHRERLEAFGLLDVLETDAGRADVYRLRLPFRKERNASDAPAPRFLVDEPDTVGEWGGTWSLRDAIDQALADTGVGWLINEDYELWEDLENGDPEALSRLVERWPWLRSWVDVLAPLLGGETGGRGWDWAGGPYRLEARLGTDPPDRQTSLASFEAAEAD
ncbi:helix-turn-helix domain-containing protein [Natrinema versiforme]|uniref:HTH domain-containing protein n=2 Tax=root TaxID=1 RepID=A0A4P8WSV2_9EURY|nr:HTH domain-containing protein [Natrinema versiforme]YP_010772674.1 HTH domain-containing protein [Natrinema versiforme icosahedral virus 1]QCS45121.1 HTH domain-containing protein [Natrinema versiforme]DAC85258.1 TPA_asm: HTH domain-containing protein [Natrinema versiforme icosahedral virus 1]